MRSSTSPRSPSAGSAWRPIPPRRFAGRSRAAEGGHAKAQARAGELYEKGVGVEANLAEARRWYAAAAEKGEGAAALRLSDLVDAGAFGPADAAESARWLRVAAEAGDREAQAQLGERYAEGRGVEQDAAQAFHWTREAATQGHAKAQDRLGVLYESGIGTEKDPDEAAKWFRRASDLGDRDGQLNMAVLLLDRKNSESGEGGRGLAPAAAIRRRRPGRRADAARAALLRGTGRGEGRAEALRWFERAANQGLARAQSQLGLLYAQGKGGCKRTSCWRTPGSRSRPRAAGNARAGTRHARARDVRLPQRERSKRLQDEIRAKIAPEPEGGAAGAPARA